MGTLRRRRLRSFPHFFFGVSEMSGPRVALQAPKKIMHCGLQKGHAVQWLMPPFCSNTLLVVLGSPCCWTTCFLSSALDLDQFFWDRQYFFAFAIVDKHCHV